jgi:hypothetical protein
MVVNRHQARLTHGVGSEYRQQTTMRIELYDVRDGGGPVDSRYHRSGVCIHHDSCRRRA